MPLREWRQTGGAGSGADKYPTSTATNRDNYWRLGYSCRPCQAWHTDFHMPLSPSRQSVGSRAKGEPTCRGGGIKNTDKSLALPRFCYDCSSAKQRNEAPANGHEPTMKLAKSRFLHFVRFAAVFAMLMAVGRPEKFACRLRTRCKHKCSRHPWA
eukprot:COSAG02_NODE_70_length_42239_cov_15.323090_10_plen_155_part_00